MNSQIRFSYEGKDYTVGSEAYNVNRIVLPDGRVLDVEHWLESAPPQPAELHEQTHFVVGTPQEVAQIMNGVLAQEAI